MGTTARDAHPPGLQYRLNEKRGPLNPLTCKKNHLQRQNMKPLTYYCDAAGPIAEKFGSCLESLNEEQLIDFAESIAHFMATGNIRFPWSKLIDRSWERDSLKQALLGVSAVLAERRPVEYTSDYEPDDDDTDAL